MSDPLAADHRRRADLLRQYAAHLEATPIDDLLRWAGPDTWVGPLADDLTLDVRRCRAQLGDAADDLRRHAHHLDAEAAALDEQARLAQRAAAAAIAAAPSAAAPAVR
jgi:hypothetical protein